MSKNRPLWLLFLLLAALLAALVLVLAPGGAAYTVDSLTYISAAQQLLAHHGLRVTAFNLTPFDQNYVPMTLHPPGFSLLIALLGLVGIKPVTGALLLPGVCFVLLPPALFFALKDLCSRRAALVTSGMYPFLALTVFCALMAWSDVPYLLFSLVSFGFMNRAVRREEAGSAFLAGLFAGAALLLRSLGAAIFIGAAAGFAVACLLRLFRPRKLLALAVSFLAGGALLITPYILRNMALFHAPWTFAHLAMPKPPAVVFKILIGGMSALFFGDSGHGILFLTVLCGLTVFFIRRVGGLCFGGREEHKRIVGAVILLGYVLSGLAALTAMVLRYNYTIEERYLLQYGWVILAGAVSALAALSRRFELSRHSDPVAVAIPLIAAFFALQIFPAVDTAALLHKRAGIYRSALAHAKVFKRIPADELLVSNQPDLLQLATGRNVRVLTNYTPLGLHTVIGNKRPFTVVIFNQDVSSYGSWLPLYLGRVPPPYKRLFADDEVMVVGHGEEKANAPH